MNTRQDGKTEKITPGRKERVDVYQSERVGTVQCSGQSEGLEQGWANLENSHRGDQVGGSRYRNTPIGKILQHLELVEREHIEYVHAHQSRLEARLDESKAREESFNIAVSNLKQEIYNLATQPEEKQSSTETTD
ncbi:hypothetical protein [Nostoc sp. 'Peltigera membranacea cyanobiont' 232]|uniref:hypothetical protein n=1 Tax=Nostoc sp. 'Peltigera membranacea cyanobiont' 232 TaxID=2014531 RepID=UPI000B957578|nr:hypothetical protein [Nostoc sp. 'Peltigera membranacea cyanobiont' 232]OYE03027.1 hypothetical protein CDG79_20535 [Nostoc sp. 'Peltigera membranacea cyanobiont' 232]